MEYDKKHWTVERILPDGSRTYKAKRSFESELRAQQECFKLNLKPETIHKLVSYKCPICNKWHIGHHGGKQLNEESRKKIQKQYNEWKLINNIK